MRNVFSIALTCLLTLSFFTSCEAKEEKRRKVKIPNHSISIAYAVQTVSVRTGCFSQRLQGILAHIAARTGRRPLVTSGHRPRSGRSGSLHRTCQAADIRVPGVSESSIIAAALSAPGIGGVGRYCNGIIHVDIGPRRNWTYCGKGKGGILSARRRSGRRT
ncbi:hypothetical protein QO002_001946 [Pararhizobium capsulatum DSM 1112]|uniref:Peptidase M15 n=1 Tax=Pararhizobium capsulatum DSM 1112 TaxID=1121113 RepID=A0ABU0BPG1_9HYPH|nr:DUF882 domain-containing protein [Pararhizobium capsulatum]MDQ0319808.1 hypothetical protein [Pararhizobium capsulatum DSM 1112]